ncbi:hypothetical protein ACQQ2Q_09080 [Agrobacterium sp. ES01]
MAASALLVYTTAYVPQMNAVFSIASSALWDKGGMQGGIGAE